jgi:hypothetical protein
MRHRVSSSDTSGEQFFLILLLHQVGCAPLRSFASWSGSLGRGNMLVNMAIPPPASSLAYEPVDASSPTVVPPTVKSFPDFKIFSIFIIYTS